MSRFLTAALVAAAALAAAGTAAAHVIVHPNVLPGERLVSVQVRVLNERTNTNTTKVDLKFPDGFIFVYYQPVPGWKTTIVTKKLQSPIVIKGQTLTQQVDRIVWTVVDPAKAIRPYQFMEIPLAVAVPGRASGTVILFKALQYYSNGEIVRWIGDPGAEFPAAQVVVADPNAELREFPAGPAAVKGYSLPDPPVLGFAVGLPALGLAGLFLHRSRRRAVLRD